MNKSHQNINSVLKKLKKSVWIKAVFGFVTVLLSFVVIFSLTIAWQTNVVQTGGLTFTTEKWNFKGEVSVDSQAIIAAPGDSGAITLTLTNKGDGITSAGINIDKTDMSEEMQKRMYFYTDSVAVRNSEKMQKVYISSQYGYTYTLFPRSEITPDIYWQWVYDVVGYYVVATVTTDSVEITDYIRPIEYEFDLATTTFVNGQLNTVNGSSVSDFLQQVSSSDGFDGTIDTTSKVNGYYKVNVDSNGYGVWAYLCSYEEIIDNMGQDTQLGAEVNSCNAKIKITGYNSREEAVSISSEEELVKAIESASVSLVTLNDNITLSSTLSLNAGTTTMIDLNGYTLSAGFDDNIISAHAGALLLVQNGTITGTTDADMVTTKAAVYSSGGYVTLQNVKISNVVDGVSIYDSQNDIGADSKLTLTGCEIITEDCGVYVKANGELSEELANITIDDCVIHSNGLAGVMCNGDGWGTNIAIRNSTITGKWAGIYHPQLYNSYMKITGSTVSGYTGIAVKSGVVDIVNCTVSGTGAKGEPAYSGSGWADTGDGIYVEANYGTPIILNISGDNTVVTSAYSLAVQVYEPDAENVTVNITGGTYSTIVDSYVGEGYKQITAADGKYVVSKDSEEE